MPRFRMFAGPNGSGKTTLFQAIFKKFERKELDDASFGLFLNADELEKSYNTNNEFNFGAYNLIIDEDLWTSFLIEKKRTDNRMRHYTDLEVKLTISENKLYLAGQSLDSYLASIVIEFVRDRLLEENQSFCFETVMSHLSKVNFLEKANSLQYKTYLYYVCTESIEYNKVNVANRVLEGGHNVPTEKIVKRYYDSLNLLASAIKIADKTYLFDTTNGFYHVASIQYGVISYENADKIPNWVNKYVEEAFK